MLRLLIVFGLISLMVRLVFGKWPWEYLTQVTAREAAVKRARNLLGIKAFASRTEVIEAHRRLIAMVHPDRGGTNEQVHEANAARDLLLAELPDES